MLILLKLHNNKYQECHSDYRSSYKENMPETYLKWISRCRIGKFMLKYNSSQPKGKGSGSCSAKKITVTVYPVQEVQINIPQIDKVIGDTLL